MKTEILQVLVLGLMLMNASALKCNYCSLIRNGKCVPETKVCPIGTDTCISATVFAFDVMVSQYVKQCISMADCIRLRANKQLHYVQCCQTDLCN